MPKWTIINEHDEELATIVAGDHEQAVEEYVERHADAEDRPDIDDTYEYLVRHEDGTAYRVAVYATVEYRGDVIAWHDAQTCETCAQGSPTPRYTKYLVTCALTGQHNTRDCGCSRWKGGDNDQQD